MRPGTHSHKAGEPAFYQMACPLQAEQADGHLRPAGAAGSVLGMDATLTGRRIIITGGPTRGPIDAVRYISNRSSGRLGSRIAEQALRRGAAVALVAGPGSRRPDPEELSEAERGRLRILPVETVDDLIETLRDEMGANPPDAAIHAMAVLDYVPEAPDQTKTPSGRESWTIKLVRTPKVIKRIREWAPDACLVQFKLEVGLAEEELRAAALDSLRRNRSDLVVANDLARIRDEVHPALILDPSGKVLARPGTKTEIASLLCDLLAVRD